jgi:hypothetical protein
MHSSDNKDFALWKNTSKNGRILVNYKVYCKVGFTVSYEDLEILERFKELVVKKYGKLRGGFNRYIMDLIKAEVLSNSNNMQHHAANYMQSSIRADIKAKIEKIRRHLIEKQITKDIPESVFINVIREATGLNDNRSIKKYYNLLLKLGCKRVPRAYTVFINVEEFLGKAL